MVYQKNNPMDSCPALYALAVLTVNMSSFWQDSSYLMTSGCTRLWIEDDVRNLDSGVYCKLSGLSWI